MDTTAIIFNTICSFTALYVGIVGVFFNQWGVNLNVRITQFLYERTKLPLFKFYSEKMKDPFMAKMYFVIGIVFLILGIQTLVYIIFGVNLIPWLGFNF